MFRLLTIFRLNIKEHIQGGPKVGIQYILCTIVLMVLLRYSVVCTVIYKVG